MQNERPGAQGRGLAAATRQLIDTADSAEAGRRTPQVERAIAAFLAQPAGSSAHLDDAQADQALILAHHFGVDESYFTDPGVAETVTAQRREHPQPWRAPHAAVPAPRTAADRGDAGSGDAGSDESAAPRPRKLAGVALATAGVLVGAAVGGAVGYHVGDGAGRHAVLAEGSAHHDRSAYGQPGFDQHGPADHHAGQAEAPQDAARRLMPAVVQLRVHAGNETTTGAGFVLSPDGMLVTNDHVIAATAHGGQLTVEFQNGTSRPAHVIGRDAAADIAVVAAENVAGLTPIRLGNSDQVRVGEQVMAIGSPLGPNGGQNGSVAHGVVSGLTHAVAVAHDPAAKAAPGILNAIQTDVALNPADSGGPLVDQHGMVIGIATVAPAVAGAAVPADEAVPAGTAVPGGPSRTGYAIPANLVGHIAVALIDASRGLQPVLGLRVGITGHPATPAVPSTPAGAKIIAVAPGSPAGNAGLKPGDVVVGFDGHPVASGEEFIAVTRTLAPADTVQLSNGRSAHVVLPAHQAATSK